jgi:hypothetical protein
MPHGRKVDSISRKQANAEKSAQSFILKEASLAIEIWETLNVHHKVEDLKTSQNQLLNILFTVCRNLGVHWVHCFEEIDNEKSNLVIYFSCLLFVLMENVVLISLIKSFELDL